VKRSTDRILTTHTGSLPRPPDLAALLRADGSPLASEQLRQHVRAAVHDAVERQVMAGIDIVSDGEMGKPGFAHYVKDRPTGFQGQTASRPFSPRDLLDYPEVARRLFVADGKELPRPPMPANDGPIAYIGWDELAAELETFSAEAECQLVTEAFVPAVSPGCVAMLMGTTNRFHKSVEGLRAMGAGELNPPLVDRCSHGKARSAHRGSGVIPALTHCAPSHYGVGVPTAAAAISASSGLTSNRVSVRAMGPASNASVPSGVLISTAYVAVAAIPLGSTSMADRAVMVPGSMTGRSESMSWKNAVTSAVRSPVGCQTPTPVPTPTVTSR
jgi:hypothetical protein